MIKLVESPLGCYEESRYRSRDEMIRPHHVGLRGGAFPAEVK